MAARVKGAGGRWDAARKLWGLPAGKARELGLEDRAVLSISGV